MSSNKTNPPLLDPNFQGPTDNAPRKAAPLQSKAKEEPKEEKEPKEESDTKEATGQKPKKPLTAAEKAEAYREGLAEVGITEEKARSIMDGVIFEDAYIETIQIGGKRLTVGLRTRSYRDMERIMDAFEADPQMSVIKTDDIMAKYNVAASLARYGDHQFNFPDPKTEKPEAVEEAFEERLKFLLGLPSPIIKRLIDETGKFDMMMTAVFADGAPEDF